MIIKAEIKFTSPSGNRQDEMLNSWGKRKKIGKVFESMYVRWYMQPMAAMRKIPSMCAIAVLPATLSRVVGCFCRRSKTRWRCNSSRDTCLLPVVSFFKLSEKEGNSFELVWPDHLSKWCFICFCNTHTDVRRTHGTCQHLSCLTNY